MECFTETAKNNDIIFYESGVALSNCLVIWRLKRFFEMSTRRSGRSLVPDIYAHLWNKIKKNKILRRGRNQKISMERKTLNPTRLIAFAINCTERKTKKQQSWVNLQQESYALKIQINHWKCKFLKHKPRHSFCCGV